jgi:hypothetical protein
MDAVLTLRYPRVVQDHFRVVNALGCRCEVGHMMMNVRTQSPANEGSCLNKGFVNDHVYRMATIGTVMFNERGLVWRTPRGWRRQGS